MLLGDLLVANGVVSKEDVRKATERQKTAGGLLGENLVALEVVTAEQLQEVIATFPDTPKNIADTGLKASFIETLMLKLMYVHGYEMPTEVAAALKLSTTITNEVLDAARDKGLLEVLGSSGGTITAELRFALTGKGRDWATEALDQCQYIGAAPVPLSAYCDQIERQAMSTERVSQDVLTQNVSHLVLPDGFIDELGPAVNSGRAILLYGPPGNGKSSIAEAIGASFEGIVYIPYAIEVDGQIIKVFDPTVHDLAGEEEEPKEKVRALIHNDDDDGDVPLRKEDIDQRWVACKRPVMITGGELTLDMLDFRYDTTSRFYEAPLQVKAMNGVFIIDDFGRQAVAPKDLLNRWIIPLEKRVDYLALHTGKKFLIPFDELVIFSTNLSPADLMDEAFLRRIPYKIPMERPSVEDFIQIFVRVCEDKKIKLPEDLLDYVFNSFYKKQGEKLASHHPKFIVERIFDKSRYTGGEPHLDRASVDFALRNLAIRGGEDNEPIIVNNPGPS
ncbi:MAG: ATPase [Proteobacteria bacterium]|nr:ATPase [Pseudomonadota bacterium]